MINVSRKIKYIIDSELIRVKPDPISLAMPLMIAKCPSLDILNPSIPLGSNSPLRICCHGI
jgi:hypothetical protein